MTKLSSCLVTGGAGFLGSALVHRLIAGGHPVRVLDDASRGRWDRLDDVKDDVELISGDVRDPDAVRRAVHDVERVFHFAAVNGTEFFYSKPEVVLDVGVGGTLNVVRACAARGDVELYVASSSEVYQTPPVVPTAEHVPLVVPDPLEPRYSYGGSKIISELLALNFGRRHIRKVVVFRPHNAYGPDMGTEHVIPQLALRIRDAARRGHGGRVRLPIQGTGAETRAFIFVEDFVDGVVTIVARGEHMGIYNVGTDQETRIDHVAFSIARCLGIEIDLIPGPPASGATLRRCPDITRLRALGFEARTSLEDGIAQTVRWYEAAEPVGESHE
jgi:nucleoside-diphosphate-sugar epimerase